MMRVTASGHLRIVIMTMAMTMPVVTVPNIFMVQNGEGSSPVGLR